jgi:hypothetical protein
MIAGLQQMRNTGLEGPRRCAFLPRRAGGETDFVIPGHTSSYLALRVCPHADESPWWAAARRASGGAPPAMRAILAGRSRVEVSPEEAWDALSWARSVDGWDGALAPIYLYPREASAPA